MRNLLPTRQTGPTLTLGSYQGLFRARPFVIGRKHVHRHRHIIGRSGSGKSYFIESLIEQLVEQGIAFSLIDPAGDLAFLTMRRLTEKGFFAGPERYRKLLYIDFSDRTRVPPFNIFKMADATPKEIAETFAQACLRVWPTLAGVGVLFQDIIKHAGVTLIYHGLTLADMPRLLTKPDYRNRLLDRLPPRYRDVVDFFRDEYDAWGKDAPQMRQSTMTRLRLLTFDDTLKAAFSHPENLLDIPRLINGGTSVIYNLGTLPLETQKLLGCLISLGYERAAYARAKIEEKDRLLHFLFMDEFALFSEHNQAALQNILSYARKYNVFLQLAHQNFGQTDDELKNSLQNAQTIAFALTYDDAKWMAPRLSRFSGFEVKHEVADEQAKERSHPLLWSLPEIHARKAQELEDLDEGHAYVKFGKLVRRFRTLPIPAPSVAREQVLAVMEHYARTLLVPMHAASMKQQPDPTPIFEQVPFSRRHPRR